MSSFCSARQLHICDSELFEAKKSKIINFIANQREPYNALDFFKLVNIKYFSTFTYSVLLEQKLKKKSLTRTTHPQSIIKFIYFYILWPWEKKQNFYFLLKT